MFFVQASLIIEYDDVYLVFFELLQGYLVLSSKGYMTKDMVAFSSRSSPLAHGNAKKINSVAAT